MKLTRLHSLSMPLAAALSLCAWGQAYGADWQKVLGDRGRTVEIDRESIFDSDRGTKVSWGRVVLADAEAATAGYRTIKALNRYDCPQRSFFTIKRVYLDFNERVLREESVADQTPVVVTRDTADERMWREVCRPPGGADLQQIAEAASKAAASAVTAAKPVAAAPAIAPPPKVVPVVEAKKADVAPKPPTAAPVPATPVTSAAAPAKTAAPSTPPAATTALGKPAQVIKPGPTPAAMPIPSIRPDLAALAAKNQAQMVRPANATPAVTTARPPAPATQPTPATLPPPAIVSSAAPPPAPARAAPRPAETRAARRTPAPRAQAIAAPRTKPQTTFRPPRGEGWSYAGDTGPDRWGGLRPDWKLCSTGLRQSPIDLRNGIAVELDPVKFDYGATRFRIIDTGNMLRVNVDSGMTMEVRGQRYMLDYITLHRPSEERVGGGASDMVVHFHHRDGDGKPAMLGVLLAVGEQRNAQLQVVLNNLPLEKGSTYMPEATIDLAALLPSNPGHFLYMGSLTTPPCTEGVLWVVMKEPVVLSAGQLEIFTRLYPRNSRPIQPTAGRLVLESR